MSRDKGKRGELEVAAVLSKHGYEASRNARNGISGRDGGQDIAHTIPGVWLEVKRAERLAIPAWVKQAEDDCPDGCVPLVVYRRSREPWRVVLRLDDLLGLMGGM